MFLCIYLDIQSFTCRFQELLTRINYSKYAHNSCTNYYLHRYETNEHHMFCLSLVLFVCLFLKTALFGLKRCFKICTQSAFYDVDASSAENVALVTVTSRKQHAVFGKSNYLPLLLYRIPLNTLQYTCVTTPSILHSTC